MRSFPLAFLFLVPRLVHADAPLSGVITSDQSGGAVAVANAFVAITNGSNKYSAVTDGDGNYSVADVASGTYSVVAQAPGHAVGKASGVVVVATPVTQDLLLTPSNATFSALGVYGAQIASLAADGASGIFYAATSVIPQLFRSSDFGGSWTQVTMSLDDADDGLAGDNSGGGLTASGYPGELAIAVNGHVYASTDFGVTWTDVPMPQGSNPGPQGGQLFWGHAGSTNVLLNISGTQTFRADMSSGSPSFSAQASSYLSSPNDRMTVATGSDGAWVAVVDNGGTLNIYDLAANPPGSAVSTLSGLPNPPTFVRLGGAKSAGVPPDAVLVYANGSGGHVVLATKSGGNTYGSVSTATAVPGGCGQGPGSIGSIAPQSTGTAGNGTISQCWITKTGTTLALQQIGGINNNTGLVFDAAFDGASDQVLLSGDGNRGVVKSAHAVSGVPVFPSSPATASPGTDAGSGGVAVNGITVPVVKDSTFGPSGAAQIAVALSPSGGGLMVASDDGGATFLPIIYKGGKAVAWWTGSAGTWLAMGHAGAGDVLSVVADWTAAQAPLVGPNVNNTGATSLGFGGTPEQFGVTAIAGVPGADTVFVGSAMNAGNSSATGAVYRASLSGSGSVVSATGATIVAGNSVSGSVVTAGVTALAYCPTTGSDTSAQDVLLVATGTDAAGTIVRITGATGETPTEAVALTGVAVVNDVRMHCGSGTVYAGVGSNSGGPSGAFYKSSDGGASFAPLSITGPGVPPSLNVQVVAVDPSDANTVQIAGNSEGIILGTTDGGTTWTLLNDPHNGGRNFLSEGVGDLEIPPASAPLATHRTSRGIVLPAASLVATGGGLFAADFGQEGGGGGGGCTSAAQCADDDACSTDTCTAGVCGHTLESTITTLVCRIADTKTVTICADPKTTQFINAKLDAFQRLAQRMVASTKAKQKAKLKKSAGKLLDKIGAKIAKAKKTDASCKGRAPSQISALRALLDAIAD